MEGTADDFALLLTGQLVEVHGVARNTDRKIRICLGIFVCLQEGFPVHDVDVDVVRHLAEVAVENGDKVGNPFFLGASQCFGGDGEGVGDTET